MKYLIFAALLIFSAGFGIGAFILANERKQRAQEEKEKREEIEKHEETVINTITEANKTKADARSGNHSRDLDFMASKLHDYANK